VYIVLLVTGGAGRGCLVLIEMSGMATHAGCRAMLPDERVLRVSIMIKGNCFPILLAVTFFALIAEVRPMGVVFLVAGVALSGRLVFIESTCMTTLAFRFAMVALEEVRGISIMLKEHDFPIPLRMAALTLLTETAFMLIVLLVAGMTIDRSLVLIEMPFMARVALGQEMTSSQRIFCV